VPVRGVTTQPLAAPHPARPKRRWWVRLLRITTGTLVIVLTLSLAAFGGLLLITPGVSNAEQLAQTQDAAHHVAFPGPTLPVMYTDALLATEDHRFAEEPGIDPFAVAKAAVGFVVRTGDPGGATLYQQLAKLLYTPGQSGPKPEAESLALAVKLRYSYTGPQILQMYSDIVYYGNGFYGLAAASCGYFGVTPAGLTWPQAAMLAGLVNGPTLDDPLTNPANGTAREDHVVGRLVASGTISAAQGRRIEAVPLTTMLEHRGDACTP
jgi:penicillin-binding protein 1A